MVTELFVVEELVINSVETKRIDLSGIAISILAAFPIKPVVIEELSPMVWSLIWKLKYKSKWYYKDLKDNLEVSIEEYWNSK